MYNKCDKCNRHLENYEERRLVMDTNQRISTRCIDCYKKSVTIKPSI